MTVEEIIAALRCTAGPSMGKDCAGCPYRVVETLTREQTDMLGTDTWESCDSERACLDAANALERMAWIPVTERLPEPGKRVLATDGRLVGEAYITETGTWWRSYGAPWRTMLERSVTHWMELPEGPGDV